MQILLLSMRPLSVAAAGFGVEVKVNNVCLCGIWVSMHDTLS